MANAAVQAALEAAKKEQGAAKKKTGPTTVETARSAPPAQPIDDPSHTTVDEVKKPVIVSNDVPADEANQLYGEGFGVDWAYAEPKADVPERTIESEIQNGTSELAVGETTIPVVTTEVVDGAPVLSDVIHVSTEQEEQGRAWLAGLSDAERAEPEYIDPEYVWGDETPITAPGGDVHPNAALLPPVNSSHPTFTL